MSFQSNSDWYRRTEAEINAIRDTLDKKTVKKYRLDFLPRISKRVAQFAPECGKCQLFQQDITGLTHDLRNMSFMSNEQRKHYFQTMNLITSHLQKDHKLVREGQYTGIMMSMGTAIGVAIGGALFNPGTGIALGVALGIGIGSMLDAKAKKEGRVI